MAKDSLSFFIAGIIQGSIPERRIHPQDYRLGIKQILRSRYPECRIIDPLELHPRSLAYGPAKAQKVFFEHIELASQVDVLVCYLPEASMGTAIEMYQAWLKGTIVLTITPMISNWVVRFFSDRIFPEMASFARFIDRGGLGRLLKARGKSSAP